MSETLLDTCRRNPSWAAEEIERLRMAIAEQKAHATALDINWAKLHEAAMAPIRAVLGDPHATVIEICHALTVARGRGKRKASR